MKLTLILFLHSVAFETLILEPMYVLPNFNADINGMCSYKVELPISELVLLLFKVSRHCYLVAAAEGTHAPTTYGQQKLWKETRKVKYTHKLFECVCALRREILIER